MRSLSMFLSLTLIMVGCGSRPGQHKDTEPPRVESPTEPTKIESNAEPVKIESDAEPVKIESDAEPAKVDSNAGPANIDSPVDSANSELVHYGPKDFLTNYGREQGLVWTSDMHETAQDKCLLTTKPLTFEGPRLLSLTLDYEVVSWILLPFGQNLRDKRIFAISYDYLKEDGTAAQVVRDMTLDSSSTWTSKLVATDEEHQLNVYFIHSEGPGRYIEKDLAFDEGATGLKVSICGLPERTRLDVGAIDLAMARAKD